jgi:hypothetical protein
VSTFFTSSRAAASPPPAPAPGGRKRPTSPSPRADRTPQARSPRASRAVTPVGLARVSSVYPSVAPLRRLQSPQRSCKFSAVVAPPRRHRNDVVVLKIKRCAALGAGAGVALEHDVAKIPGNRLARRWLLRQHAPGKRDVSAPTAFGQHRCCLGEESVLFLTLVRFSTPLVRLSTLCFSHEAALPLPVGLAERPPTSRLDTSFHRLCIDQVLRPPPAAVAAYASNRLGRARAGVGSRCQTEGRVKDARFVTSGCGDLHPEPPPRPAFRVRPPVAQVDRAAQPALTVDVIAELSADR